MHLNGAVAANGQDPPYARTTLAPVPVNPEPRLPVKSHLNGPSKHPNPPAHPPVACILRLPVSVDSYHLTVVATAAAAAAGSRCHLLAAVCNESYLPNGHQPCQQLSQSHNHQPKLQTNRPPTCSLHPQAPRLCMTSLLPPLLTPPAAVTAAAGAAGAGAAAAAGTRRHLQT